MSMSKRSHQDWVDGALSLLCEGGIEAVRVEPLAKQLGVSKGSFYWHFENRRALHLAILDRWEEFGTSAVIKTVEAAASDPAGQLHVLIRASFGVDEVGDAVEVAIRSWAQTDSIAGEAAARVDARRLAYVVDLLVATGLPRPLAKRRSNLLYRALIGATTWRMAGGPTSTKREMDELTDLLLQPG